MRWGRARPGKPLARPRCGRRHEAAATIARAGDALPLAPDATPLCLPGVLPATAAACVGAGAVRAVRHRPSAAAELLSGRPWPARWLAAAAVDRGHPAPA